MENTNYCVSKTIRGTIDSSLSGSVPNESEGVENIGGEVLTEKRIIKEKKYGRLRIKSDGEIAFKNVNSSSIKECIKFGIIHAVGAVANTPQRDVLMKDFMTVESKRLPIISNDSSSKYYSLKNTGHYIFKTYAPIAFKWFRDLFCITSEAFLFSFCEKHLVELPNPGGSGSLFYLTHNYEFITKTVQKKESDFLQKLLSGYFMNLSQNPLTLLPKFFGLYCLQYESNNVRLLVMNNILPMGVKIHHKYDLKGSTYNRKATEEELQKDSFTFKDMDFIEHYPEGIFLERNVYDNLMNTIKKDCRVLESFDIMDYSLLVGIHNLDQAKMENAFNLQEEEQLSKTKNLQFGDSAKSVPDTELNQAENVNKNVSKLVKPCKAIVDLQAKKEYLPNLSERKDPYQEVKMKNLPFGDGVINIPVEVNRKEHLPIQHNQKNDISVNLSILKKPSKNKEEATEGNFTLSGLPAKKSNGESLLLYVGIIDILQSYKLKKKLEHIWKSTIHEGNAVSVHNPAFYSQRFQKFLSDKVFQNTNTKEQKKSVSKLKHDEKKPA